MVACSASPNLPIMTCGGTVAAETFPELCSAAQTQRGVAVWTRNVVAVCLILRVVVLASPLFLPTKTNFDVRALPSYDNTWWTRMR